jgi:hypothetical protein
MAPNAFPICKRIWGAVRLLRANLRVLEEAGLVVRTAYAEVPPRVEYGLTPEGMELRPLINDLYAWGQRYIDFEGVLAQPRPATVEPGDPLSGVLDSLHKVREAGFHITLSTSRDARLVRRWLQIHAPTFTDLEISNAAPDPSVIYLSPRSLQFTGTFPSIQELRDFCAEWTRQAHNLKVEGSNPSPATTFRAAEKFWQGAKQAAAK